VHFSKSAVRQTSPPTIPDGVEHRAVGIPIDRNLDAKASA
jgi:hypothetical protein